MELASITADQVKEKLTTALKASFVEVIDTSGGCGSNFEAIIVSDEFEGKATLARHRMVNKALQEELKEIHAFSQKTYTPKQWEAQQQQ
eukprot:Nk52_evm2s884 gene=Nk52_evmTU2s884